MKSLLTDFQPASRRILLGRFDIENKLMRSIDIIPNQSMLLDLKWSSQHSIPDSNPSDNVDTLESLKQKKTDVDDQLRLLRSKLSLLPQLVVASAGPESDIEKSLEDYGNVDGKLRSKIKELEKKLEEISLKIGAYKLTSIVRSNRTTDFQKQPDSLSRPTRIAK